MPCLSRTCAPSTSNLLGPFHRRNCSTVGGRPHFHEEIGYIIGSRVASCALPVASFYFVVVLGSRPSQDIAVPLVKVYLAVTNAMMVNLSLMFHIQ